MEAAEKKEALKKIAKTFQERYDIYGNELVVAT